MTREDAHSKWDAMHRNCKTAAQLVEMTETSEYAELLEILFPVKFNPKSSDKSPSK